jgi:tRNA A37 threonylcarbamoyltransferase TsaD
MTQAPDHLKSMELFTTCDTNGTGMLNKDQWYELSKKTDEYNKAKYGGVVPMSRA